MADVPSEMATRLMARLRIAMDRCAGDENLLRKGRWLSARCLIAIGDQQMLLDIRRGAIGILGAPSPLTSWDFALLGSARAWTHYWRSPPPPGWHDLLALAKRGELRIEGNLHPFMTHLQYLKDLLESPRGSENALA